jgi:hypothetical protein
MWRGCPSSDERSVIHDSVKTVYIYASPWSHPFTAVRLTLRLCRKPSPLPSRGRTPSHRCVSRLEHDVCSKNAGGAWLKNKPVDRRGSETTSAHQVVTRSGSGENEFPLELETNIMIVTLKPKSEITIPKSIRRQAGINLSQWALSSQKLAEVL